MSKTQIEWENIYLKSANIISFWFPKESLCPITLFELGKYLCSDKQIFIGIDPQYVRKIDVEIQTLLERPNIQIVFSINDLVKQIINFIV